MSAARPFCCVRIFACLSALASASRRAARRPGAVMVICTSDVSPNGLIEVFIRAPETGCASASARQAGEPRQAGEQRQGDLDRRCAAADRRVTRARAKCLVVKI